MVEALRQNVGKENRNKDARKQTENHELTVVGYWSMGLNINLSVLKLPADGKSVREIEESVS